MQTKNLLVSRQKLRQEWNRDILNLLTPRKPNKSVSTFQNPGRDSYIPSENSVYEIYVRKTVVSDKFPQAIVDIINFDLGSVVEDETGFTIDGVKYLRKDMPSVSLDRCNEIRAENNEIVFERGKYYKFQDREGKYHVLDCRGNSVSQPYSEQTMKRQNEESFQMGKFWGCIGCEGVYGSKYYSDEEQRKILKEAGIQEGFFSVQVGDKRQELFLSNGAAGAVVPKRRYDGTYNMFMNTNILDDYAVGSVFVIGGKEYILDEHKKLDIPYGADIYDIKFPMREK
ncbi:MAG: hypothetical protein HFH75_03165 [Lachnospiraceae bacterium]|jgi:hypothetical protein|nr:hypothetical protein [Lachnospiraceae bacterium]